MRHESDGWRKRCGCLLLALCVPLGIHAATPNDYAWRYALTTDGSSAAWRVELNPAIYAVSQPATRLRDLIVVNADGQPVPFGQLPPAPTRTQAFALKTMLLPLPANSTGHGDMVRVQRNSDGAIVIEQPSAPSRSTRPDQWLIDAGRPASLDRIEIAPSALPDDARFHVSVQASNDLQHWSARGEASEIVSIRRSAGTLSQRFIAVANGTPSRYYRLTLRDGDNTPWDTAQTPSVELHGSVVDPLGDHASARQWLAAPAAVTAPSTSGANYDYTLPAALPLEAVRITLTGNNTVTRYSLLDRDDNDERLLLTGTAVQIGTDADNAAPAGFTRVRVQQLRLHTDTPLAQAPTLSVAWRPDVFVFLAEGRGPYTLLAGSNAARRGDYPLQVALDRIHPSGAGSGWQPPLATLGATSVAAGPTALLAPKPPFDWTGPLLWLVLIGGALAVLAMAWSLLRQSRREGDKP